MSGDFYDNKFLNLNIKSFVVLNDNFIKWRYLVKMIDEN